MACLFLALEDELHLAVTEARLGDVLTVDKKTFVRRPTGEHVFYDWIAGHDGMIDALEIHLEPAHPILRTSIPLCDLAYVELGCFPRVWFGPKQDGVQLGKEAFGDIEFMTDESGTLGIAVGLDEWLSGSERGRLLQGLTGRIGLAKLITH